jgi:hypothetical protein
MEKEPLSRNTVYNAVAHYAQGHISYAVQDNRGKLLFFLTDKEADVELAITVEEMHPIADLAETTLPL